jgi:hypothetical protein
MSPNDKPPGPVSSGRRQARRLRIIGIVVLLAGIAGAGMVYWMGTRSPDFSNDPTMAGYNRAETQQLGILYGKQGVLIQEWSDDLKQPGTQAIIIAVVSAIIASGCFYFARLSDDDTG